NNMFNFSCRLISKQGDIKWVHATSRPIKYQEKQASLVSIVDITDQKEAEENLKRINKLKTELLRRTSHELKTPLVSIKGFTNLLLEVYNEELHQDLKAIINEIRNGSERLENLIMDILETSKLESGKVTLKKSKEDLSLLIKFTANSLKTLAELRQQTIEVSIHDKLETQFEKEKIQEVLENLISNSIKYTPPYGKIEINSEIKEKFYIISISDDGIGFTEEEKKDLFTQFGKVERFGQGWDLNVEGSGLGLYISKEIIKLHGGEIWLESEGRNKGSTFYFSLPIIK
ncbi:MAG: PAS domain-containing sensor histidine kinase, partial [Promethearchaeia archaeon]